MILMLIAGCAGEATTDTDTLSVCEDPCIAELEARVAELENDIIGLADLPARVGVLEGRDIVEHVGTVTYGAGCSWIVPDGSCVVDPTPTCADPIVEPAGASLAFASPASSAGPTIRIVGPEPGEYIVIASFSSFLDTGADEATFSQLRWTLTDGNGEVLWSSFHLRACATCPRGSADTDVVPITAVARATVESGAADVELALSACAALDGEPTNRGGFSTDSNVGPDRGGVVFEVFRIGSAL